MTVSKYPQPLYLYPPSQALIANTPIQILMAVMDLSISNSFSALWPYDMLSLNNQLEKMAINGARLSLKASGTWA